MKDIKIGKLTFHKKAIQTIAFCAFLNGLSFGAFAVLTQDGNSNTVFFLLFFAFLFMPYILFRKTIKNNISELT